MNATVNKNGTITVSPTSRSNDAEVNKLPLRLSVNQFECELIRRYRKGVTFVEFHGTDTVPSITLHPSVYDEPAATRWPRPDDVTFLVIGLVTQGASSPECLFNVWDWPTVWVHRELLRMGFVERPHHTHVPFEVCPSPYYEHPCLPDLRVTKRRLETTVAMMRSWNEV